MKSILLSLETLFIALLSALVLTGCSSHRPLQVAEHLTRDTVYINKLHYDSIYIDHWQKVYQQSDTIYLDRTKYEYRYRLLRDTIYKTQIDSIPVIREVEVVREVRHVPAIYRFSLAIVVILVLSLIIFIIWKICI